MKTINVVTEGSPPGICSEVQSITEVSTYTVLHIFAQFGLFMMYNAYVPVGGNERGRGATPTPTSISIFDSYHMKTL